MVAEHRAGFAAQEQRLRQVANGVLVSFQTLQGHGTRDVQIRGLRRQFNALVEIGQAALQIAPLQAGRGRRAKMAGDLSFQASARSRS